MSRGNRRLRRTLFKIGQEDAWWRTSYLLAEIHNGFLAQIQAWGGAKDAKHMQPKEMNPLHRAAQQSEPAVDRATIAAFEFARQREEEKRGQGLD